MQLYQDGPGTSILVVPVFWLLRATLVPRGPLALENLALRQQLAAHMCKEVGVGAFMTGVAAAAGGRGVRQGVSRDRQLASVDLRQIAAPARWGITEVQIDLVIADYEGLLPGREGLPLR